MLADRAVELSPAQVRTARLIAASFLAHLLVIGCLVFTSFERVANGPTYLVVALEPTLRRPCEHILWREQQDGCVVTRKRLCVPAPAVTAGPGALSERRGVSVRDSPRLYVVEQDE